MLDDVQLGTLRESHSYSHNAIRIDSISYFAENKEKGIEYSVYSLFPIPYLIESILLLIWSEYGIRNGITFLIPIPYFIKLMSR